MSAERFEKLAKSKFDIKVAKLNLLERVESELTFTHNGGAFKATPELMAVANFYFSRENDIVLLDDYGTPILVNLEHLREQISTFHQFALNAYLNEYTELKKVRNGEKL
jgi:hypothetical protein